MNKRSISIVMLNRICNKEKARINNVNTELYPNNQEDMTNAINLIQKDVKDFLNGRNYDSNHEEYFD